MGAKILRLNNVSQNIVSKKPTTLSADYPCDVCGQPAMTKEDDRLRCPSCWLREKGQQIKPIDRGGYYP
tara:strand:+ start:149 stop:355 length:207 start_codon:yes stop_codon:yes gene_type:complete